MQVNGYVLLWQHYLNQDGNSHARMARKETANYGETVFLAK